MVFSSLDEKPLKLRSLNSEPTRFSNYGDISSVSGTKILSPDELLLTCENPNVSDLHEVIIHWAQAHLGVDEFALAKKEFHSLTGKVFPDEAVYHQRINYFLDYFTFQRPVHSQEMVNDNLATPYQCFITSSYLDDINASESLQKKFVALGNFRHSLFKILKITKNKMVLKDLFQNDRIEVMRTDDFLFSGFTSGSIFQGFLFFLDETAHFSQGMLIHPAHVAKIVEKSLRLFKRDQEQDKMKPLTRLAKQHLILVRQRNFDAQKIYTQDPR